MHIAPVMGGAAALDVKENFPTNLSNGPKQPVPTSRAHTKQPSVRRPNRPEPFMPSKVNATTFLPAGITHHRAGFPVFLGRVA